VKKWEHIKVSVQFISLPLSLIQTEALETPVTSFTVRGELTFNKLNTFKVT